MPLASCSIISLAGRCGGASIKPWPSTVTGNGINAKPVRKLNCRISKTRIVAVQEPWQECVGGLNRADPAESHLLDQPILQRAERAFHATFSRRRVGTDDVDVELMERPAELGHAVAADRILLVDPEDRVLVRVEGNRASKLRHIGPGLAQIVER